MTRLDAVRSFAAPGYCPVRKVRVLDSKWYLVTLQNVERDQGDGMYLGAGEYTLLLPGAKAREYKVARLNHCNGIQEWQGPVYELQPKRWGRNYYGPSWATCEAEVLQAQEAERKEWQEHLAALDQEEAKQRKQRAEYTGDDPERLRYFAFCESNMAEAQEKGRAFPWTVAVQRIR